MIDGFYRYVLLKDVQKWLDQCWIWADTLPLPHGYYSCLVWLPDDWMERKND